MRSLRLAWVPVVAALALSACGAEDASNEKGASASGGKPAAEKVTLGISTASFGYLPIYVAQEKGYFKEAGIELDFVEFAGGSEVLTGMLSGDVDIAGTSSEKPLFMYDKGQTVVNLVSFLNKSGSVLLVSDDVKAATNDIAGLKGETLGVTKPGSGSDIILRTMLKSAGLDPDKDVTIIAVGGTDAILSGLESGQIKGAIVAEPIVSMAQERGIAHPLVDPRAGGLPEFAAVPQTSALVKPSFYEERPEVAKNFIEAITRAQCVIRQHPDQAVKAATTAFPSLKPDLALKIIKAEAPLNSASYTPEGHTANLNFYKEQGIAKAAPYETVVPPAEFQQLWKDQTC